jgi:hypothetical protein
MIQKRLVLTTVILMFVLSLLCGAQTQEPSVESQQPNVGSMIEQARAEMQADRTAVIIAAMNFSDKDAALFWPIYRQYEYERSTLEDSRVAVIREYAKKYPDLTDTEAKSMAEQMFDYDARLAALKKKYFKKFNKALPALTVTKFFQLDRRLDLVTDMQMESSLPPLTQARFAEKTQ